MAEQLNKRLRSRDAAICALLFTKYRLLYYPGEVPRHSSAEHRSDLDNLLHQVFLCHAKETNGVVSLFTSTNNSAQKKTFVTGPYNLETPKCHVIDSDETCMQLIWTYLDVRSIQALSGIGKQTPN